MLLHQKINAGRKEDTGAGELEASSIGLFILGVKFSRKLYGVLDEMSHF